MEVGTGIVSSQIALNTGTKGFIRHDLIDVYGINRLGPDWHRHRDQRAFRRLLTTNGSSGSYLLGNVYNNTKLTVTGVTQTDTLVQLGTAAAATLTSAFWKGGFSGGASDQWAISTVRPRATGRGPRWH